MKFAYEYRTRDNVRHTGEVVAPDREAAFQKLREQGIRPGRLIEAPGFFNKLFGKGKRWLLIVALGVLCLVLAVMAVRYSQEAQGTRQEALSEDRAQLFGDPSVIQKLSRNGWRNTFPDAGEAWLARHAIPGKLCGCALGDAQRKEIANALMACKDCPIAISEGDGLELSKMKRMVNGMKQELVAYIMPSDPDVQPSVSEALEYMDKACERCRVEHTVHANLSRDLALLENQLERGTVDREKSLAEWDKKNATLRSMGLPTIPQPE